MHGFLCVGPAAVCGHRYFYYLFYFWQRAGENLLKRKCDSSVLDVTTHKKTNKKILRILQGLFSSNPEQNSVDLSSCSIRATRPICFIFVLFFFPCLSDRNTTQI